MKSKLILIILFIICAHSGIATADYLLVDQSYMAHINSWHNLSYYTFAQEFRPSFSSMDAVEVVIHTNEGAILQADIHEGSVDGSLVGISEQLYLPPGFTDIAHFIFTSPVPLVPGSSYIIELRLVEGSADIASSFEAGGYPEGYMFIDGICTPTDNSDIIFRTGLAQTGLMDIKTDSDKICLKTDSTYGLIIAIISSDIFDATTVNPETVLFAGAHVRKVGKNGKYLCRESDTNNDGFVDLVCHIDSTQMVIKEGDLSVVVQAVTFDGITIIGEETVCIPQDENYQ